MYLQILLGQIAIGRAAEDFHFGLKREHGRALKLGRSSNIANQNCGENLPSANVGEIRSVSPAIGPQPP